MLGTYSMPATAATEVDKSVTVVRTAPAPRRCRLGYAGIMRWRMALAVVGLAIALLIVGCGGSKQSSSDREHTARIGALPGLCTQGNCALLEGNVRECDPTGNHCIPADVRSLSLLTGRHQLVTAVFNITGKYQVTSQVGGGRYVVVVRAYSQTLRRSISLSTGKTVTRNFMFESRAKH